MCAAAIYWAGIPRIVYGCSSALLARYAGAGFAISLAELFTGSHNPPELIGPLLEEEAGEIHKSFWAAYDQRARE
jgi:tRNA(Arg) A34 adenosine deaminase TadA